MLTNIVIPVHNRLEHARQTFETLLKHTDRSKYFLAIIDDASDRPTELWLNAFHAQYGEQNMLLHRTSEPIGPGACKNLGFELLKNKDVDFFYVSDSDVYFKVGWLEHLKWAYLMNIQMELGYRILGGARHPYHLPNERPTIIVSNQHLIKVAYSELDAQAGFSHFMTIDTFLEFGPYIENSDQRIMASEDFALCQKVKQAGYKVGSVFPEVIIHTGKTNSLGGKGTGHELMLDIPGVFIG